MKSIRGAEHTVFVSHYVLSYPDKKQLMGEKGLFGSQFLLGSIKAVRTVKKLVMLYPQWRRTMDNGNLKKLATLYPQSRRNKG